jgi:integrase
LTRARGPKTNRDDWGSITLERNRWRLRYLAPDGKRRSAGAFRTKDEAEAERARLRVLIEGGEWRAKGSTDSPAVSAFAQTWLAGAEARDELAPRTVALYKRQLDRLVLGELGGLELGAVPIAKLTRALVDNWDAAARAAARKSAAAAGRSNGAAVARRAGHPARTWARASGLTVAATGRVPDDLLAAWQAAGSPTPPTGIARTDSGLRQYEQARTALSALCTAAVDAGYLAEHPVRRRPGSSGRKRRSAERSPDRVRVVSVETAFALANAMPRSYGVAALVSTFAHLRGQEVFALCRRHLTFDHAGIVATVTVDRALVEVPDQRIQFGPPKSSAGTRTAALPRQIGTLLAEYVRQDVPDDPDALLFTTTTNAIVTRRRWSAVMANARAKVGVPTATWHGLRHTGLTLAASVPGVTLRDLMTRGGHSTPRAALLYQHTAADADARAAMGLGDVIAVALGPSPTGTSNGGAAADDQAHAQSLDQLRVARRKTQT